MNKYLLDTNICIYLLNDKFALEEKIERVGKENCFISSITLTELIYGAEKSKRKEQNRHNVKEFSSQYAVIPFEMAMEEFARQKVHLQSIGRIVGDFDIMIGATAIANDMILVTHNVKDFENMQGIEIENWVEQQ